MKLIEPNESLENEWKNYIEEVMSCDKQLIPASANGDVHNYRHFLKEKEQNKIQPLDSNLVPSTLYFMVEDDHIFGMVDIRHCLNDYLFQYGGHIGYGIRPSKRGQGYGNQILALALEKCRALGLDKVLVTCKKYNQLSANVIMKNGGVLENEVALNGEIEQRYWIQL